MQLEEDDLAPISLIKPVQSTLTYMPLTSSKDASGETLKCKGEGAEKNTESYDCFSEGDFKNMVRSDKKMNQSMKKMFQRICLLNEKIDTLKRLPDRLDEAAASAFGKKIVK